MLRVAQRRQRESGGDHQTVHFSTPRFLSAKRSAVSSLREEVAQRNPLKGVPLDSSRNRGTASLWHPGAARHGHVTSRALLRTFECSIVGGTTDLLDPTRRKANFLWKFLCAGGAAADCAGDPIPTAVPPQGFLQSKNALRRRKTVSSLTGSLIVERIAYQIAAAIQKESAIKNRRRLSHWSGTACLEPMGFQKGRNPFVMLRSKRNKSNFFAAARHGAYLRS